MGNSMDPRRFNELAAQARKATAREIAAGQALNAASVELATARLEALKAMDAMHSYVAAAAGLLDGRLAGENQQ